MYKFNYLQVFFGRRFFNVNLVVITLLCLSNSLHAQVYTLGNTGQYSGWFRLGTLQIPQDGSDAVLEISAGNGYNANFVQQGSTFIHFRTSNGDTQTNGFYASGMFYNTGRTKLVAAVRVLQLAINSYEFYVLLPPFTGSYSLLSLKSPAGTWTGNFGHIGSTPTGSIFSDLTEEFTITSNTNFTGNVGLGIFNPTDKLAVNGNIRAKEIKVEATNWPDYVFDQDYKILGLNELDAYIKQHKHLPEMPAAKEVEANGMALGELVKLQQKKIEELTLHLIDQNKKITIQNDGMHKQDEKIAALESLLKTLIKNH
nr:hypothetical protein [uncultured Pedobacter sp.]